MSTLSLLHSLADRTERRAVDDVAHSEGFDHYTIEEEEGKTDVHLCALVNRSVSTSNSIHR